MMRQPKILIIYTGGTIGMIENAETKALEPFDFDHLIDNVPKIRMLDFDIDNIQFETPIDSSSMNPQHWKEIAEIIRENYSKYDGFVVLHGTDTMAYTASALSYMFENLDKPVVITGSQLPIGEMRTDGEENLITALQVAAARDESGKHIISEVVILFENSLWRGNRSTKHSANAFNAFTSNNYPALAHIGLDITFNEQFLWHKPVSDELLVHTEMDSSVMYLDLFPGIREDVVRYLFRTPGIKGIVLRTFGAGNAYTDKWFIDAVKEAVASGVVIVNITQCSNGSVNPRRYLTGWELWQAGVVPGHDLTAEAAITKLMYLFGLGMDAENVKKYMEIPLRGEMTCTKCCC